MSVSQKEKAAPSLTDIVSEWMKGDPLICEHFRWEWPKTKDPTLGYYIDNPECFYIGAHPLPDFTQYAVGFVGTSPTGQYVITWAWEVEGYASKRLNNIYHDPADPQFFETLKSGLIAAHNSLNKVIKCAI